jgi:hypothetical protein
MVPIGAYWHTRDTVIVRGVLLIAALSAALVAGLLAYSKHGQSQTPPAPACTVAACDTNGALPGGWPTDSGQP